jgi:hypothetical protein
MAETHQLVLRNSSFAGHCVCIYTLDTVLDLEIGIFYMGIFYIGTGTVMANSILLVEYWYGTELVHNQ